MDRIRPAQQHERRRLMDLGHYEPVIEAARAGLAVIPADDRKACKQRLQEFPKPCLVVIGDDVAGQCARGPNHFDCSQLRRLIKATVMIAINAAAGQPEHYAAFVVAAKLSGTCLVIETQPNQEAAWRAYAYRHGDNPAIITISPHAPAANLHQHGHA